MDPLAAIPVGIRVALLAVAGACLGSLLHFLLDLVREESPRTSPWSAPPAPRRRRNSKQPPRPVVRPLLAYVPVLGWLARGGESRGLGGGFWLRPLVVELALSAFLPWLYLFETQEFGLLPPLRVAATEQPLAAVHAQYLAHVLLVALMLLATLIDIDETIIPDPIIVPGTLAALLLAGAWPDTLLPAANPARDGWEFLTASSPAPLAGWLAGTGGHWRASAGAIGCGLFAAWCCALAPRLLCYPHRWRQFRRRSGSAARATVLVGRRLRRDPWCWILAGGLAVTVLVALAGGRHWAGYVTALIGLAAGGAVVWTVRIIGRTVLGREAMGFGDVTLLAMVGAFLGWQAAVLAFFVAPVCGLAAGLVQLLVRGKNAIPYGPFLCGGALAILLSWATVWPHCEPLFGSGWIVQCVLVLCAALMAVLLGLLRWIKRALGVETAGEGGVE